LTSWIYHHSIVACRRSAYEELTLLSTMAQLSRLCLRERQRYRPSIQVLKQSWKKEKTTTMMMKIKKKSVK